MPAVTSGVLEQTPRDGSPERGGLWRELFGIDLRTVAEKPNDNKIGGNVRIVLVSAFIFGSATAIPTPSRIPMIPPRTESETASIKN